MPHSFARPNSRKVAGSPAISAASPSSPHTRILSPRTINEAYPTSAGLAKYPAFDHATRPLSTSKQINCLAGPSPKRWRPTHTGLEKFIGILLFNQARSALNPVPAVDTL